MPSSSGRRRVKFGFATIALAAAVVAGTAGCGAGQITQTDTQMAAVNGDEAEVGPLRINNVTLAYPEGGFWAEGSDVPLSMTIGNGGGSADELQQISSPDAEDVVLEGDTVIPSQRAVVVGGEPAEPAGEAAAAANAGEVGKATATLQKISKNLYPGMVVKLTLTFREAGPVELRVPIAAPGGEREEPAEQ